MNKSINQEEFQNYLSSQQADLWETSMVCILYLNTN